MKAVVMYMSRTGNTERAAELVGAELVERGVQTVVRPIDGLDYNEVADADLICVGTWVDGIILFGHRAGDTARISRGPALWDKPVGAFMTYALHAGKVLQSYQRFLEDDMGAKVVAGALMKRGELDLNVGEFVDQLMKQMEREPAKRFSAIF